MTAPARDDADVASGHSSTTASARRIGFGIALSLIALLARIPRLTESLWYDEIAAWMDYGSRGPRDILTTYFDPANHVLHTLLTWISFQLFEPALGPELTLRLPALVFSLATVHVIFGLAHRVGGDRLAMIAGLLAAGMPVLVFEGTEARGYSMMIFFSAAATWQFLRALDRATAPAWLLYAILCALGTWSHPTTAFVAVGHALCLVFGLSSSNRRTIVAGLASIAVAAAVTILLYAPVLDDLRVMRGMFSAADGDEPSPFGREGLHALFQLGGSWAWSAALPGWLLLLAGTRRASRDETIRRAVLPAGLGGGAFVVIITLAGSWMYARFLLFMMPGAILLIAASIDGLGRRSRATAFVACIILLLAYGADLTIRPPKQPLREAAAYVRTAREAGDRTLVLGLRHPVLNVYAMDLDPSHTLPLGTDLADQIDRIAPEWIVTLYPRSIPASRIELIASQGYATVARFRGWADWDNGDIIVSRKVKQSPRAHHDGAEGG